MAISEQEAIKLADKLMQATQAQYQLASCERQTRQGRDCWFIAFEQRNPDLADGTISFFLVDVETGELTQLPHP